MQAAAAMNMKGKYDHIFTTSGDRSEIISANDFRFRQMKCTAVHRPLEIAHCTSPVLLSAGEPRFFCLVRKSAWDR